MDRHKAPRGLSFDYSQHGLKNTATNNSVVVHSRLVCRPTRGLPGAKGIERPRFFARADMLKEFSPLSTAPLLKKRCCQDAVPLLVSTLPREGEEDNEGRTRLLPWPTRFAVNCTCSGMIEPHLLANTHHTEAGERARQWRREQQAGD